MKYGRFATWQDGSLGSTINFIVMQTADISLQAMLRRVPTSSRYEYTEMTPDIPLVASHVRRTFSNHTVDPLRSVPHPEGR